MAIEQLCRWHVYTTAEELYNMASRDICVTADNAIRCRGVFRVVLCGGRTPRELYRRLRRSSTDWRAWHIYLSDERCLSATHPERNSVMVWNELVAHVAIPRGQIHFIPAELGDEAVPRYQHSLEDAGPFDMVLLGLGEDGHVASLFPGNDLGDAPGAGDVIAVQGAPKPFPDRISLSARRLSQARRVLCIACGEAKRQGVLDWRHGRPVPAAKITPEAGVDAMTSVDAWGSAES